MLSWEFRHEVVGVRRDFIRLFVSYPMLFLTIGGFMPVSLSYTCCWLNLSLKSKTHLQQIIYQYLQPSNNSIRFQWIINLNILFNNNIYYFINKSIEKFY